MNASDLKWYIAYYPGPNGQPRPYREVSPGMSWPATDDDLETWEVVKSLKEQVELLRSAKGKGK